MRLNVLLGSVLGMFGGKDAVPVRQVCVVSSFLVVARFVMLGGFVVVARGVLVVLRCLTVMAGCFL